MPREIFTVTDEMREDLRKAARQRGMTVSTFIRRQLTEILAREFGRPSTDYDIDMGGVREPSENEDCK
jgi:hypothetical protein